MNGAQVVNESPVVSEVAQAAVVVAVDLVALDLAEAAGGPGGQPPVRTGNAEVEVVEVLKGRVAAAAGDRVTVPVEVRVNADLWGTARAGERYVAFCDAASTDLRVLLTPAHCHRLAPDAFRVGAPPPGVLEDVRLVRSAQRRHLTADRLIGEAAARRASAGPTYARYVWSATRTALRIGPARFDRIMTLAEDPATRREAQEAYLTAAYEDLTMTGAFDDGHRARLVRAMLRSSLDPRLADLRGQLLGVQVPNLVTAALPAPLTPAQVFDAAPGDTEPEPHGEALRAAVLAELEDPRDPATTSPALVAWLTGREG